MECKQLQKFNIKSMLSSSTVLLLGRKCSGKSFLLRDILYHHKEISSGLVFSGSEKGNPFFVDFIQDSFIHSKYDPELIELFTSKQKQDIINAKKNGHNETGITPDNRSFIILDDIDDIFHENSKKNSLQNIFFNGRHYNLFFLFTMQYPLGIHRSLRCNIDYIFVFNEDSIKNRKKIYEDYVSNISFNEFENILDSLSNFECIVIDKTNNGIFLYKASNHQEFKVGSKKI